ncbi:MAG: hypothetical protein KIS73_24630, partial [Enhydrobacter sp.]|nr:hypothetical protein [Enhydrobacter sp.]
MPDSRLGYASPTATRGQPPARPPSPGAGLPLVSTAPLTADERIALRDLARALRVAADRVDEAVTANRVPLGLEACTVAG